MNIVKNIDWISFFLITLIASIGLLFVLSATYSTTVPFSIFFKKQAFGLGAGLLIFIISSAIDYRTLARWGYALYFVVIGLLLFTLIKGTIGMGAQRWINLFFFKLQPSELVKLFFPAFAVHFIRARHDTPTITVANAFPILLILGLSFVLILKQPDLGTALIVLFSGIVLLWLLGINKKFFLYSLLFVVCTAPVSWRFLKPYQKKRVEVFLGYGSNNKERYQIEQSKIAIGSGGLWGKGFLKGTQNKLQFLPEGRTDFIFAVMSEELGFSGALFVLILYILLFLRFLWLICIIPDRFMQILATGLIIHIVFSTVINIGMVLDLLPIVGIPLPLMSYGLSNLWITFASLGWFNSIAMHRSRI